MSTQNIYFDILDITGTPAARGSKLQITPVNNFVTTSSNAIVSTDRQTVKIEEGGIVTVPLFPAPYSCSYIGNFHATNFLIDFTSSLNNLSASDLIVFNVTGSEPVLTTASLVTTYTESDVVFAFVDSSDAVRANVELDITPVSRSVSVHANSIVNTNRVSTRLDDSGSKTVTLIAGIYSVRCLPDTFTIQVPDTASVYQARNLICILSSTGSLFVTNALSASYSLTASFALVAGSGGTTLNTGSTYPVTASWADNATTASYSLFAESASFSLVEVSSSHADFADSAANADFAVNATSASYALSASWAGNVPTFVASSSHAGHADTADTASFSLNVPATASFAVSSSFAVHSSTSDTATSASFATHTVTADSSTSSSYALSASYSANVPLTASYSISSSHADRSDNTINADSASFATHAVNADSSTSASYATKATNADTASSINFTPSTASFSTHATSADTATSSSYSVNADTASFLPVNTYPITASQAVSASYATGAFVQGGNSFGTSASIGTNDQFNLALRAAGNDAVFISSSISASVSSSFVGIGVDTAAGFPLAIGGSGQLQLSASSTRIVTSGGSSSLKISGGGPGLGSGSRMELYSDNTTPFGVGVFQMAGGVYFATKYSGSFMVQNAPNKGNTNNAVTYFVITYDGKTGMGINPAYPTASVDIKGDLRVSTNITCSGIVSSSLGFTGSLFGTATTASFVTTAQTASYVTASNIIGVIASASFATNAATASSINFTPSTASFATKVFISASLQLYPQGAKPPLTNSAVIDAGNQDWELLFTGSATSQTASYQWFMDSNYVGSPVLNILSTCKVNQTGSDPTLQYNIGTLSTTGNIVTASFDSYVNSGSLHFALSQSKDQPKLLSIPIISSSWTANQVCMLTIARNQNTGSVSGSTAIVAMRLDFVKSN